MKNILVCTDFSDESDTVVKAAEELRKRVNGNLYLLHVSTMELDLDLHGSLTEQQIKTHKDVFLGDIKKSLSQKLSDQANRCHALVTPLLKHGSVSKKIFETLEEDKYDLLVMGHGESGIFASFLGGVVRKMIAAAPIPVLVIKTPLTLHKVAGLVDESRPLDWFIVLTFQFCRSFQCKDIEFVSLWQDLPIPTWEAERGIELEARLKEEVKYFTHPGERTNVRVEATKEIKVAHHLVKLLEEEKVDLIVIKRHRGHLHGKFKIGSEARRLLELFPGNLLICPI